MTRLNNQGWRANYDKLFAFVSQNNHLPRRSDDADLYRWVRRQKQLMQDGQLSDSRCILLQELNYCWRRKFPLSCKHVRHKVKQMISDSSAEIKQKLSMLFGEISSPVLQKISCVSDHHRIKKMILSKFITVMRKIDVDITRLSCDVNLLLFNPDST
jgi:hypothetical protein